MTSPADQARHIQETFLALGDEFLVQYFLSAHLQFRNSQILSRLFSMGHSLELYLKAALTSPNGSAPTGHRIPDLLAQFDASLELTEEEAAAGRALFSPDTKNVDLGLWFEHQAAMELYQAQHFVTDLKYYLKKDHSVIFPARMSLLPVNHRYLKLVQRLRAAVPFRAPDQDHELVRLIGCLGFESNPALSVLSPVLE